MITAAAIVACLILLALAVFQALLIAGRPLGRYAWGGQHDVLPRKFRIGSAISILLYAVIAIIILENAGIANMLPEPVAEIGIWAVTTYFAIGIVMNGVSRSKPERNLMTPVCIVLTVLCLIVALG